MNRSDLIAELDAALSWYTETATWLDDVKAQVAAAKIQLYPLIIAIAKGEKLSWWDDEDQVEMLRAKFPEKHDLWNYLTLKVTTSHSKSFEEGYCHPISLKGVRLAIPGKLECSKGHERFSITLEHGLYDHGDARCGNIWRSAHDNKLWCYEFRWGDAFNGNTKFRGTKHEKIRDVVADIVAFLTNTDDKSDREVLKATDEILTHLKVSDDVPEEVLNRRRG